MARGQIAKAEVMKKIQSIFDGAFLYNDGKELRVPIMEDGELIQIKVTLTAAKDNVEPGDDNAIPGSSNVVLKENNNAINFNQKEEKVIEPTEEEKSNVKDLLAALGL